jgi:hypothetical protein
MNINNKKLLKNDFLPGSRIINMYRFAGILIEPGKQCREKFDIQESFKRFLKIG